MHDWVLVGKFGLSGDARGKLIDPTPFRVGRRAEASLTLPRATVSGLHAELEIREDRLYVRDLASTNGTFINGERISSEAELKEGDVVQFADVSFRVEVGERKRDSRTISSDFCEHALARVQFEKLLREQNVIPYYQPIVDLKTSEIIAFEALARSRLVGLETPGRMFAAAADLQREAALSDLLRLKGVEVSQQFDNCPHIFLNTHPDEFAETASWDWVPHLREVAPHQALTVEIHEGTVTDVSKIARFRALLDEYEIGLAFDDFGAGQARIAELADVRPKYLKFDRRIITGLDQADSTRQRFVRCLIDAIRNMGVISLAEGIETADELQVCRDLGFELGQGYFLGMPNPVDVYRSWPDINSADSSSVRLPIVTTEEVSA